MYLWARWHHSNSFVLEDRSKPQNLTFKHDGTGTDLDWDSIESVGFVDENGVTCMKADVRVIDRKADLGVAMDTLADALDPARVGGADNAPDLRNAAQFALDAYMRKEA